jgi:hypothetical protein
MESEDVVHVLRRFRKALVPQGLLLDLQVIPPDPIVELDDRTVCKVDGSALLDAAAAAAAEVDAMVDAGLLAEEAIDDHDVRKHYSSGAELVDDFADSARDLPREWIPRLAASDREHVVRERCRTRRLRSKPVIGAPDGRHR